MSDTNDLLARIQAIENLLKAKGLASECEIKAAVNKCRDDMKPNLEFDVTGYDGPALAPQVDAESSQLLAWRQENAHKSEPATPAAEEKKSAKKSKKEATPPSTPLAPDADPPSP